MIKLILETGLLSSGSILPAYISSIIFSMDIVYESFANLDPNDHNITVKLLDSGMNEITTVSDAFVSGNQVQIPPLNINQDLTSVLSPFAGQMIYIEIENIVNNGCFPSQIDNVSLLVEAAPIPTLSQWGIITLSMIMLIFGLVFLRKKRLSFG